MFNSINKPEPRAGAASKWDIREKVWEHLEAAGLAEFPRPVRGRIPNFKVRQGDSKPCPAWPGTLPEHPQPPCARASPPSQRGIPPNIQSNTALCQFEANISYKAI
uniref:Uncharacterized protein n=1 Tax=Malurus cyaneus samueli TaxID=2593467 RepID=A0A8C5T9M0_9PASS